MPSREVRVAIIGDPSSLQRALSTADRGVSSFSSKMNAFGSRMRTVGSSLSRNLTLPLVGFGILAARELAAGEQAMAQTRAVIESMGIAAEVSVDQVADLASEMHELSGMDDEGIQEMLNTLLTFREVVPIFEEAGAAALDVAAFFGGDLQQAATQVGRALNNPLRGMTALSRRGVEFTEEQRNAVEAMMAFGNTADAQRIILEELRAEYGGQAEALGGTLTGRLNRLKNDMEELGASILEDLLPVLEDLAGIFQGLADRYSELTPTQRKFVAGLVGIALIAGPLTSTIGLLTSGFGLLTGAVVRFGVVLGVSTGLAGLLLLALASLGFAIYLLVSNWDAVASAFTSFFTLALSNIPGLRQAVLTIRDGLSRVGDAASTVLGWLSAVGQVTFPAVIQAIQGIGSALGAVIDAANSLLDIIGGVASAIANLDPLGAVGSLPGVSTVVGESAEFFPARRRVRRGPGTAPAGELERAVKRGVESAIQQVVVLNPSGAF